VKQIRSSKAFTLIELLIVVAIIAILAAIAVPNFLEAQTRSKVSRSKSDLRTLVTGLEAYRVDFNEYPRGNPFNTSGRRQTITNDYPILERLSSPVAYLTSGLLEDPFTTKQRTGVPNQTTGAFTPTNITPAELPQERYFKYMAGLPGNGTPVSAFWDAPHKAVYYYVVYSVGPDLVKTQLAGTGLLSSSATPEATVNNVYDPTNGTISTGDIWRVGGESTGQGNAGWAFFEGLRKVQQ
jgi:prepilin-type N-terminal cleavage/methylation domain-containing protein